MIVCKPKSSVTAVFIVLLLLGFALLFFLLFHTIRNSENPLPKIVVTSVCIAVLIIATVRLLFSHKVVTASKEKIKIIYKLTSIVKKFDMKELKDVKEERIKTFNNSDYKRLIILIANERIIINNQVYDNYNKLKVYLERKKPKKKTKK